MSYPYQRELLMLGLAMTAEEVGLLVLTQHGTPSFWTGERFPAARKLAEAGVFAEVEPGAFAATELGDAVLFQLLARRACG